MKLLKLLALSFLLTVTASAEEARVWQTIYRGKAVEAGGQSWKSTVGLHFIAEDGRLYACSGVFIEDDVLLTAAHCRIKNKGSVEITFYRENSTDSETFYADGDDYFFRAHPRYRKARYDAGTDDLAVLVLKNLRQPEGFSPSPVLHSGLNSAILPGRQISVVGAGRTERGNSSDRLYFAQGKIASYEPGDVMRVTFPSGVGVCGGDSGGPVFVKDNYGTLHLAALTTAVEVNLRNTCGTVLYANFISDTRYDWILDQVATIRAKFAPAKGKTPVTAEAGQDI